MWLMWVLKLLGAIDIPSSQHIKKSNQELRDVELCGANVHVPLCIQPPQRSECADGFVIRRLYN